MGEECSSFYGATLQGPSDVIGRRMEGTVCTGCCSIPNAFRSRSIVKSSRYGLSESFNKQSNAVNSTTFTNVIVLY